MPAMVEHADDVWPAGQDYWRPIVCTAYLLVTILITALLTKRLGSWQSWRRVPLMQALVVSLLGGSLLFVFASAIIILGIGSSKTEAGCNAGIFLCIFMYAVTKVILYILLLEKLHVVHRFSATGKVSRLRSWWYRGGLFLFVCWIGVAIAMIVGRIGVIREHDGACLIGLRLYATVPMLTVDAITNIYLTVGFILPIWRSNFPKAKRLARVSAIAAIAALITSFANIFILTLQHGHQLSFVCLGSCGLDVAFNSVAVYFVTSAARQKDEMTTQSATFDNSKARTSRNASIFPGSVSGGHLFPGHTGNPFALTVASGGVGVTVVEEVRVEEDREIPLPPIRRASQRPLMAPVTTVSFNLPNRSDSISELEAEEDEEKSVGVDEKEVVHAL
ncbi:hypothetical protein JCM10207_000287 [Rhodosporidiobolus poonsookiae]